MIKKLDREFLIDTAKDLGVYYPWEWIDSFNDIYEAMIITAINNIDPTMDVEAYNLIIENIYYNYLDTRIDLSVDDFLEKYPDYKDKREELEMILY